MTLRKIISGGQTGVDRAALDVALALGVSCGGWCPKGRLAEDGPIPQHYPLQETTSSNYSVRTERNVQSSDATLILNVGELDGGTALTADLAYKNYRPFMVINLDESTDIQEAHAWLLQHDVSVLNIAGPRASKQQNLYEMASVYLKNLIPIATK
jgi:hypothetical protein